MHPVSIKRSASTLTKKTILLLLGLNYLNMLMVTIESKFESESRNPNIKGKILFITNYIQYIFAYFYRGFLFLSLT